MKGNGSSACAVHPTEIDSAVAVIDLSILMINWNSCNYLRLCLESICNTVRGLSYEILVIDNASYDGCDAMLASEFPQVLLVQSEKNLGFAKANNLGVARSSGRNLLFLNPDTVVLGSAIKDLLTALERSEGMGMVGARILNSDLSLQTTCIMPVPSIWNQFLDIGPLRSFYVRRRLESKSHKENSPESVAAVSGACMMVRRSVMEEVGHFCMDYFMYVEDIDLCVRVKQAGWKVGHVRSAEIIHHGGGSSTQQTNNHFGSIMIRESVLRFFLLRRGRYYAALYRPSVAVAAFFRILLLTLFRPFARDTQRVASSLAKWKNLLAWSLDRNAWSPQSDRAS